MVLTVDGEAIGLRSATFEFVDLPLHELSCRVQNEIDAMAIRTKALFMFRAF